MKRWPSPTSIGYPVVMKIASPDILHKSDAGGVKVGVADADAVREAFDTILKNAKAYKADATIWGVSMQQMVTQGKEVILGMSRDAQFGPMLMFGLGGIYVEVLKDVTFRIAPLTERDAREMITKIRSYKMLTGVRGEQPVDIDATGRGHPAPFPTRHRLPGNRRDGYQPAESRSRKTAAPSPSTRASR